MYVHVLTVLLDLVRQRAGGQIHIDHTAVPRVLLQRGEDLSLALL